MDRRLTPSLLRTIAVLIVAGTWIWAALAADRLTPYARGWVDGVRFVVSLLVCVAVWRPHLAERRRHAVELAGRKARWLAKHPDSVVGRGES